jgi:tetratricopeptide (TPR) repeat protein
MFRSRLDLTEQQVADAAHVTRQMVCLWERGKASLTRDRLVEVLGCVDVPPEAVDEALFADDLGIPSQGLSLPTEPPREERTLIHRAAAAAGQRTAQATRTHLLAERHRETAREHRAWAEQRWSRLAKLSAERQEPIIGALFGDEKSWALAERLCLASAAAASHQASEALRLARLAVRLAERSPGPEAWLLRLCGWCEPFLANATRVGGELSNANKVFVRADDLWARGAAGDPYGLLDGTRRLDLRASLLRQQGHFDEALALLEQALAASPPEAAARLMIIKAATHTRAGDYELALQVLEQTDSRIDEQREPRQLFLHRFSLTNTLCHLERFEAAEPLVTLVETLAADLGNELDQVRTVWLKGKTWAGLGRVAEALAFLSRVRRYFRSKKIAYDFALVTLEVAVLHLDQGRTRLVQELARELLWIFEGQKVHTEALAALTLFCRAAEAEEAGAEWTRSLIKYLYRAQHNPSLHFEP